MASNLYRKGLYRENVNREHYQRIEKLVRPEERMDLRDFRLSLGKA